METLITFIVITTYIGGIVFVSWKFGYNASQEEWQSASINFQIGGKNAVHVQNKNTPKTIITIYDKSLVEIRMPKH